MEVKDIDLFEAVVDIINRKCAENVSNTPDFILGEYLMDCLEAYNKATKRRDKWYSVDLNPIDKHFIVNA